jgi:chromate transporter
MRKEATPGRVASSFGGARLLEVLVVFARLGCLSFGGPIAHLGYFHAEVVERRRWIDDARYADLVALCQFLPGPASSQVVFALGMHRAGLLGAFAASFCFTMPSALLMIALAYGVAHVDLAQAGWLHGLKIAAVAVVAQAVRAMGTKLCPDRARISLCVAAAAALLLWSGALAQLGVIAMGALLGLVLYRDRESASARPVEEAARAEPIAKTAAKARTHPAAVLALVSFAALLVILPPLVVATRDTEAAGEVATFDSFYRSGSLVFGGGHVVLPLLRAEVVPNGWLSDDRFLAGYGGAQALPGPLFAFAAYLGTAMDPSAADSMVASTSDPSWARGLLALFAIFLPGWLLIGGALPFWQRLRARPGARAALQGANAAVVGVLLAALYDPVFVEAVHGPRDLVAALVAFVLLEQWKAPPWTVVAASAAAGQWLL